MRAVVILCLMFCSIVHVSDAVKAAGKMFDVGGSQKGFPKFSIQPCEADLCVLVNYVNGSTDILETSQDEFKGKKLKVFTGKVLSTGAMAVVIPRYDKDVVSGATIVFKSPKAGGCSRFSVDFNNNSEAKCLNQPPLPPNGELDYPSKVSDVDETYSERELVPRALDPNGYKLKVAVYYDDLFDEQLGAESIDRVEAMMRIVEEIYKDDTLQTKIEVKTVAIEHAKGQNWGGNIDWGRDTLCQNCPAARIAMNSKHEADLYVFITGRSELDTSKGLGRAAGIGTVCDTGRAKRININKYTGDATGEMTDAVAYTAEIIAHEIGHNLGMYHDHYDLIYGLFKIFKHKKYKGIECYGYMDYHRTTDGWSPCSVADFTKYLNRQQGVCLGRKMTKQCDPQVMNIVELAVCIFIG